MTDCPTASATAPASSSTTEARDDARLPLPARSGSPRRKARKLSPVIPQQFAGRRFDRAPVTDMIDPRVVGEVRRYVDDLDANLDAGRGLWLMGDVGTGKTTLAMLVSKAALERGRTVAIYSLPAPALRAAQDVRRRLGDVATST